MESQMFDNVKFEKESAIARFNCFHRVNKLCQIIEVVVVFGLISWWCSARAPAILGYCFVEFSSYLFNHHVVFLFGNAIIVLLFVLCRGNNVSQSAGGDFYDEYAKYSEAAHRQDFVLHPRSQTEKATAAESDGGLCEKQIVVSEEETKPISQCDEMAEAIEKASRQIKKFQRTQSVTLKREIVVPRRPGLRRSETEKYRKGGSSHAAEIESLSSEEFRQRVDDFIDKHWSRKTTKQNQCAEFENHQLRLGIIA